MYGVGAAPWIVLRKKPTIPTGRIIAPPEVAPPDRGYRVDELSANFAYTEF
jgi:hypothetical protein